MHIGPLVAASDAHERHAGVAEGAFAPLVG